MRHHFTRQAALAAALALALATPLAAQGTAAPRQGTAPAAQPATEFARLVGRLSEPGGFFDTDNLISNERSYLHVIGALERRGVRGGAYVGVGPDQNFSYIARVRPAVAYVVDIRRDNMLQHLLFKALFARARNRAEYLALLLGRPVPRDVERWERAPVDSIVAWLDATEATPASRDAALALVRTGARATGVPLSEADLATIARFHRAFIDAGLGLRFNSFGRAPRPDYPTLRDLVLEKDAEGRRASYLAREEDWRVVRDLQRRDLVIPVVGNLAGPHAVRAIGDDVRRRGERVSLLYTSNVEDYLLRDGSFGAWAQSVAALPYYAGSVIVRSYFGRGYRTPLPQTMPGYNSTQLLQPVADFVAESARGAYDGYESLVRRSTIPLR